MRDVNNEHGCKRARVKNAGSDAAMQLSARSRVFMDALGSPACRNNDVRPIYNDAHPGANS